MHTGIVMNVVKVQIITAVIILAIRSVSSFDCSPPTSKVICECTATSIECSGIQTNTSEVEDALVLANVSRMETVILKIDHLKFTPDFTFENTSIRNLTLGYDLQNLPSNFFMGSSSLVTLNLKNNSIQDIDDQLFSSLSELEELFLDGNNLQNLTFSMFIQLKKMKHLSIERNNLREVDADVVKDLSALETLTLSHNNVSSISNLRMISKALVELKTTHCSIKGALEKDSFSGLPNLEHLDLSHNELSEIKPHSLSTLKNIKYLDLSYNSIQHVDNYAFSEMKNLTSLDLKYNRISVVKTTGFENLKNLVYLDLSSNSLAAILCEYTVHFDSLEKIYLQDNRIKMFSQGAFFHSPNLQVLNITGNSLECSCSLTDSALYLIENSTMKREDLESISCIIASIPPSQSSITEYKSSKCSTPLEQCKRPDDAQTGFSDEDDYDYDDYSSDTNTTSTESDTTVISTESAIINTTSILTTLSIVNISLSDATSVTAESTTESTLSVVNSSTISPTFALRVTTVPNTERTTQSTTNTDVTSISSTDPVTTASMTESISLSTIITNESIPVTTTNVASIKTTSNILPNDVSATKSTFNQESTFNTTVTGITPSSVSAGDSCSSLNLSVSNFSSDSEFMIFKNFSYDGITFCLKWTIVGDLKYIKRCTIKYYFKDGMKSKGTKCPSVTNEIKTWTFNGVIYKICLDISALEKTSFCEPTFLGLTTTSMPENISLSTIITNESIPLPTTNISSIKTTSNMLPTDLSTTKSTFKSSENVSLTEESVSKAPSFFIIEINVYFNHSNLAFASWVVNTEVPFDACNMTLITSTTTQSLDYQEGVFQCKNNSHQLKNVKETDIFKVCILSRHEKYGELKECALSVSPPLESKGQKEGDSFNNSMVPLICLLILLVIIAVIIVLRNIKKQESMKYNVRAQENKYDQRVKVRPHSTSDQSIRFSYLAKENYDYS